MNRLKTKSRSRDGFTIAEVAVVIVVISILATVSIVSYGAWRRSVTSATLKNDLNGVIAAMESYKNFNDGYPAAVPSSFEPSDDVLLTGGSGDGETYCVEATSTNDATLVFYAASEVKDRGPQEGTCAGRVTLSLPGVPSNLAVASVTSTTINLTWSEPANATSYDAQCAADAAFVSGVRSVNLAAPATSTAVSSLSPSSAYYCRIKAVNATGSSAWSPYVSTTTAS